ncbi:molybdenum cofactor biosynthesis protein MoaE [Altericroceibacterium spongiae]|uniref:Molybdopterin synthase catalytic subunit n=1 Tax=Altericroceibacterium spongiae TaxID=2320269 RepID=A0A420EK09_9SPHN|nr:molybdenum cofactor biosynthesis protein MoaE [Altericroceibacterium spongiae]RKF20994.1 molybdenum cofactor biosynthesis protein MoaE [Altericroceibacterium spongiae]
MKDVRLFDTGFSAGEGLARFAQAVPDAGGIVSFVGKVRAEQDVKALELSHYEPLTLPGMEALADRALERWALDGLMIWHRVGIMQPGAPIVLVSAGARHRRDAFEAVDFAMDHLKSDAWFWKRERRSDGWHWIEPRGQDHNDLSRWDILTEQD